MINFKENKIIKFSIPIVMIILSFFARIIDSNIYSVVLVSLWLFFINMVLKKKINRKIYIFINIYILINIILILIATLQAKEWGFSLGILHGGVKGIEYNDAYNYYNNIIDNYNVNLTDYLKNFIVNIKSDNYIYNVFILYNLVISKIFGLSIEVLLISKLIFTVLSIYLIVFICDILGIKRKLLAISFFSFYQGYLYININFLRDNFIVFFVIFIIYFYLRLYKSKVLNKKEIILILVGFLFLIVLRLYSAVILGGCLFLFSKTKNKKQLRIKIIMAIVAILIVNQLSIIFGYGILGFNYINSYVNNVGYINAIAQTIIRLLIGFRVIGTALSSGLISNFLVMISPIYISLINIILFILILRKKVILNKLNMKILSFYFIFAFLNGLILVLRDQIIVERIYAMWIWMIALVISTYEE